MLRPQQSLSWTSVYVAHMEGTLVVDKKPKAVWIEAGSLKWGASKGMTSERMFAAAARASSPLRWLLDGDNR